MKKKTIIREGLDRFSIVYPYWTHLTYSEDPKVWDRDLRVHKSFINPNPEKWVSMTINDKLGGFGLDVNSYEELYELTKYFQDLGFDHILHEVNNQKVSISKRHWFVKEDEDLGQQNSLELFIYPIIYKRDYYKLRQALLDLHKIGFLVCYEDNEDAFYLY